MTLGHQYAALVLSHRKRFGPVLLRTGVPKRAWDDVLQNAAIALIRSADKGAVAEKPFSFVYGAVVFAAMKWRKRHRKYVSLGDYVDPDSLFGPPAFQYEHITEEVRRMPVALRLAMQHAIEGGTLETYVKEADIPRWKAAQVWREGRSYLRRKLFPTCEPFSSPSHF